MGRLERLCRERHARDLALALQPGGHPRGFVFDEAAGLRVVTFIESYCRHWKGEWAGQLIVLEPWQRWLVMVLFGWKRADGTRRFRKAWIEINRKNGKTFLAASIALYLLIADGEAGAEVYCTATAEEQAQLVFRDAMLMADASPELSQFVEHLRSKGGTLYCATLRSRMRPLSSESRTKDGLSPHGDIRDEVHEWNDPDLAAKLDTATGARRQPLTLKITTAGVYDTTALGWNDHEYATQILDGLFEDDTVFVFIAGCDDEENPILEPDDPRFGVPVSWLKANPNLGVSAKVDKIREAVEEARNRPDKVNDVLRLHFGRWTQQVTRWLDVEAWKASDIAGPEARLQREARELALKGRKAFGGVDLAAVSDLAAFALTFPAEAGWLDLLVRFYLPEATIERELKKKGRRHYRDWVDQGWITATPGDVTDYDFIRRDIDTLSGAYDIQEIGYDPYNATQFANSLMSDGWPVESIVKVRQGPPSLSEACKWFAATIAGKRVRHGGNPVMTWCVGNAVKKSDSNDNIAPDKKKAKDKIDGVSATVTALSRWVSVERPASTKSYLQTSELLVLP
jgi:phage terminase large subunit-like protein